MSRFDEPHTMTVTEGSFGMVLGERTVLTHRKEDCVGDHCAIHNPSDHPLKDAPMTFRADKMGLIERQCEHGVGHTDPDSLAFIAGGEETYLGSHGCDGCCNG